MIKEIWCEGDPKHDFNACHLGYGKGNTILEACNDLATKNPYFNKTWRRDSMTYWGCKLFDSEEQARDLYN